MVHEAGSNPGVPPQPAQVREVVGVFRHETALEGTIDDLLESGFDRAEISLLASEQAVSQKLGHAYRKVAELEDDDEAVRVAYVSKEDYGAAEGGLISGFVYVGALAGAGAIVASGGALGGALLAAALWGGAGGAVGLALARWLDRQRAQKLTEQLEKGGLLLWVHVRDAAHEARAIEILQRNGAEDVHAHDLTLAQAEGAGANWVPHPPLLTLLESLRTRREELGG
jgi:Flp pilus assembly protein TadB